MKLIFVSRHDIPTNLVWELIVNGFQIDEIQHIKTAVDCIPLEENAITIAIAPVAMFMAAMHSLSYTPTAILGCLDMQRVRPLEGQPTLPPTKVASITLATSIDVKTIEVRDEL